MKIYYFLTSLLIVFGIAFAGAHRNPNIDAGGWWLAMQTDMKKMDQAMDTVEPSENCDEDFIRLMTPHHQAAINMAKIELLYGKDPTVRRMAQEIITDQQSEIEAMRVWLRSAGAGNPR